MALPIALLRRHRYFIVLLVAAIVLLTFSPSSSKPSGQKASGGRKGGLGTNTWGDKDWGQDDLVGNRFAEHGSDSKWLSWKKQGRAVLVTGGAGGLAHAIIPKLITQGYTVHVADFVAPPPTLPHEVVYHRVDIRTSALGDLLAHTQYDGILHFAAVSMDSWCSAKPEECVKVNVGGTKALMDAVEEIAQSAAGNSKGLLGWSKGDSVPWVIYASSTDVYGHNDQGTIEESSATNPTTALGKTKLAGEDVVREAFDMSRREALASGHRQERADEDTPQTVMRGAVIRLSDIYGYARESSIPSAFVPHLVQRSVSSLPIQYSSDALPMDLLHVDDAVGGILRVIGYVSVSKGEEALETFNIVKGGKRWMQEEVVNLVRAETKTMSPVRDIGDKKTKAGFGQFSAAHAAKVLNWTPNIDLPLGIAMATSSIAQDMVQYVDNFLNNHCPQYAAGEVQVAMAPEDERNQHLEKLHNCTVNLGFNHDGWLYHVKCEDGKNCLADNKKVTSYNWNATVWDIHVVPSKKSHGPGTAVVKFSQEDGMGWLGLRQSDVDAGGEVKWELFKDNDKTPFINEFEVEVSEGSSALRVLLPDNGHKQHQQVQAVSKGEQTIFSLNPVTMSNEGHYDLRVNVLCCKSEGDWPLVLDDHESADQRFGTAGDITFNASRRMHLCERAHDAQTYYTKMVDSSKTLVAEVSADSGSAASTKKPYSTIILPDEWPLKPLRPCWNDCNSPTICVQTGNCRCVQADNCPRRRENPLIALSRGLHPAGQKKPSPLGSLGSFDPVLRNMVEKVDWRDLLLPEAREYYAEHPNLIPVHVVSGYKNEKEIEASPCHKLQKSHCFSADSIMYRALRHISVPADQATLVVLPAYQHCVDNDENSADFVLHDIWEHASNTIKDWDKKVPMVMMTHDWGICLSFTWEIWSSRDIRDGKPTLYPDSILRNALVFSVMGDWDTLCYRPAQDIVVPARTCLSYQLTDRFGDIHNVAPVRERPQLLTWSGTFWGTGKSERLRLACHRGGVADEELVPGGGAQSSFYNWEYLKELNAARFCPQPKGVAGWSPRVNDAIYAGCIPVLISEGSHYPFVSSLDWSQFSVRVHPTELDQIEAILKAIPLERVEQLQANLMAVRDAFLYSTDEHPEAEIDRRGPMFFGLLEAGMRLRTRYPNKSDRNYVADSTKDAESKKD